MCLTLLLLAAGWAAPGGRADTLPTCAMHPTRLALRLSDSGLTWLPGEDLAGDACGGVAAAAWKRGPAGAVTLFVHADGPKGSGRYWTVRIGTGGEADSQPVRGACLVTSTLGWRTLQRYSKGALPWLDDVDRDGRAEFVLWDSFPFDITDTTRREADATPLPAHGLVAWVYRVVSPDSLALDWPLSLRFAHGLTQEYRAVPRLADETLLLSRRRAREALEALADRRCRVRPPERP